MFIFTMETDILSTPKTSLLDSYENTFGEYYDQSTLEPDFNHVGTYKAVVRVSCGFTKTWSYDFSSDPFSESDPTICPSDLIIPGIDTSPVNDEDFRDFEGDFDEHLVDLVGRELYGSGSGSGSDIKPDNSSYPTCETSSEGSLTPQNLEPRRGRKRTRDEARRLEAKQMESVLLTDPFNDGITVKELKKRGLWNASLVKKKKGNHACNYHCQSRFPTLAHFAIHIDENIDDPRMVRKYKCRVTNCSYGVIGFRNNSELQRHEKTKHPDASSVVYHKCHCGVYNTRRDALKRHIYLSHNERDISKYTVISRGQWKEYVKLELPE